VSLQEPPLLWVPRLSCRRRRCHDYREWSSSAIEGGDAEHQWEVARPREVGVADP
jgi:hypothetical protein